MLMSVYVHMNEKVFTAERQNNFCWTCASDKRKKGKLGFYKCLSVLWDARVAIEQKVIFKALFFC